MIKVYKSINKCNNVIINKKFKFNVRNDDIFEQISDLSYDWIILANSISAIRLGYDDKINFINNYFNRLITKILQTNEFIVLTIIESNNQRFFAIPNYLRQIENIAGQNLISEILMPYKPNIYLPLDVINNCNYFKHLNGFRPNPCVNTATIKFKLK